MEHERSSLNLSRQPNMDGDCLRFLSSDSPNMYSSMTEYSPHSRMAVMNNDKVSDWNKYEIQIKQLRQDLDSERDLASQSRKKLNNAEIEKLQLTSKMNTELTSRDSEIARLRSLVEKGEALYNNVEVKLLQAQQDMKQNSEKFEEYISTLESENQNLKENVSRVSNNLLEVQDKLTSCEQKEKVSTFKYKTTVSEKENFMSHLRSENENLKTERDELHNSISHYQIYRREMTKKMKEAEDQNKRLDEQLAQMQQNLSLSQDQEATLKKDLHTAFGRIKSLEGTIEAERASHLETKFNSEVIHLHVEDLEKALEMEQTANKESKKNLDQISTQLGELQTTYEEEKAMSYKYQNDMLRLQEELSSTQNKLTSDTNDKKSVIQTMSKDLEIQVHNFNKVKDELCKSKKRLAFLEEMYNGCMREIEVLIQNFQSQPSKASTDGTTRYSSSAVLTNKKMNYEPNSRKQTAIMESLHYTLMDLSHKLNKAAEDNLKMKTLNNTLKEEISSYKQMVQVKDQTLEESQTNYTKCAKELNRLRTEFRQLEEQTLMLKLQMESSANTKDTEKNKIKELSAEMVKLIAKNKKDDEDKLSFLHSVYQRLLAGRVIAHPKGTALDSVSWFDLSLLINEQISSVITAMHKAEEKIHNLEECMYNKESLSSNMQQSYEGRLSRMMALSKEREASWRKQKKEIETYYEQRLVELQNQCKKKLVSEDLINKVQLSNCTNVGLNSHHEEEFQQKLNLLTSQHSRLQIVCTLLCGAFYPLYFRSLQLISERHLLEDNVDQGQTTTKHLNLLIETLKEEMHNSSTAPTDRNSSLILSGSKMQRLKMSPIMRFRKYAIIVLAANRMCYLSRTSKKLFSTYDVALGPISLIVQTMTSVSEPKTFAECLSGKSAEKDREACEDLLQLIANKDLVQNLTNSVSELESLLSTSKHNNGNLISFHSLIASARNAMSCITSNLAEKFQEKSYWNSQRNFSISSSLCQRLKCGLSSHTSGQKHTNYLNFRTQQKAINTLENHIVQFTKHLQVVETERRSLKSQLDKCLQEKNQLLPNHGMVLQLQEQLSQIREKQQKQVPIEKFEKLVQELKNAVIREKQADKLLSEQAGHLSKLTSQLEIHVAGGTKNEHTLAVTKKNLNEQQAKLKKKEQTLSELKSQLSQYQTEKVSLQQNLKDAENTLKTASRDKIALQKYLKSVQETFNQIQEELNNQKPTDPCSSLPLLLKAHHIPTHISKSAPELIACQNLVKIFVDCQHQANRKICIQEDNIASMKKHIASLKKEFCRILEDKVEKSNDLVPSSDAKTLRKNVASSKRLHGEKPTLKSNTKLKSSLKQSN